jgi:hypothetical protein
LQRGSKVRLMLPALKRFDIHAGQLRSFAQGRRAHHVTDCAELAGSEFLFIFGHFQTISDIRAAPGPSQGRRARLPRCDRYHHGCFNGSLSQAHIGQRNHARVAFFSQLNRAAITPRLRRLRQACLPRHRPAVALLWRTGRGFIQPIWV